jgi:small conductance mechanosensitive channel
MKRPCLALFLLSTCFAAQRCLAQNPHVAPAKHGGPARPVSPADAGHIARLQGVLEADQKARDMVKGVLERVETELRQAGMEVQEVERLLAGHVKDDKLEERGRLARERFATLIQSRSALQDRLQALEQKIVASRQELEVARSAPPAQANPAANKSAEGAKAAPGRVEKARASVEKKETTARDAADYSRSLAERIDAVKRFIGLEQKLLDGARKKAELIQGDPNQLRELEKETRERSERISRLQTELAVLQEEQVKALEAAAARRTEAERAEQRLARLENPFTLRNAVRWLGDHGPRLALIVAGIAAAFVLIRASMHRIVEWMVEHGDADRREERGNRVRTLVGVFHNAAMLTLFGGGTLMVLDECGIPIVPLMGGAAVLGLAVAFGAQSLIKDYFSGFIMLMETQYGVNDVVRIGALCGTVERITLRMTVLRDLEGVVHFIPHGQVTSVSNLTHGWSHALFEVGVAYTEDTDRVVGALVELGREMRADPQYAGLILADLEMLGVDELGDPAVVIKCFFKTRPLKQWPVKREMLRRIKKRFEELDIEIPFPHREVHRKEPAAPRLTPEEKEAA